MTELTLRTVCDDPDPAAFAAEAESECVHVLRLCDPGAVLRTADLAPTFPLIPAASERLPGWPGQDWPVHWLRWQQEWFAPWLAPCLLAAADSARREHARELQRLDHDLDGALDPASRERSRLAGRCYLRQFGSAQGARWLHRIADWAETGETPAHFPVVYACKCALFQVPLRLTLLSYAYFAWRTARRIQPWVSLAPVRPADFTVSGVLGSVRPLVEESLQRWAARSPGLGGEPRGGSHLVRFFP